MVIVHTLNTDEWLPTPSLPGHTASDDGRIKNHKGRILPQWREGDTGQMRVYAMGRNRTVPWLVLTARTGIPPKGYFVRFANGDNSDSRYDNLMWAGCPKE